MRALPLLATVLLPSVALADGAATERRLHADQVASSSFLWNDWNRFQENYHPLYVSDGDPKTAWVEGADGAGEGEWIRMQVTPMEGATRVRLRMRPGYHKSASLFKANARPREMTIKLLPSEKTTKVTAKDAMEWQEFVAEQPAGAVDAVEVRVDSVYPGAKYSDLCISDVEVHATAATRENPAFEKSKLAKVLAWKGERITASKLFKQASSKELPLLPAYKLTTGEGKVELSLWEKCEGDQICWTRETLAAASEMRDKHGEAMKIASAALEGKGTVPARMVPADARPLPSVDGLYVPTIYNGSEHDFGYGGLELPVANTISSLQSDKLGVLALEGKDVKATLADALAAKADGCKTKKGRTYTWALRDKAPAGAADAGRDRVRALVFVVCGRIEARDGYADDAMLQVAVYDAEGRLELTAGAGYVSAFSWSKREHTPVIAGAIGLYSDGRRGELTGPEIAANP